MTFVHTPDQLAPDATTPIPYPDAYLRSLLTTTRVIALIGASAREERPSQQVMRYMQEKGYRVIPVNPGLAGTLLLGELCYARLADIPDPIDMVDIFRTSDAALGVVEEVLALPPTLTVRTVWMQLGVRNADAARLAEKAGLNVVMDRCPKIEYPRLCDGGS